MGGLGGVGGEEGRAKGRNLREGEGEGSGAWVEKKGRQKGGT